MNFGMAKNFFHLFSPSAKWCCPSAKGWCPSGKSIEFFFGLNEWEKDSMDFPSGHHPFASGQHHFASGENNCKKFFAIPQYPHPYIIFWQIKPPDFIFQLLSIISHPFGFILQQTPIQNYIFKYSSLFIPRAHSCFPCLAAQKTFFSYRNFWNKEFHFLKGKKLAILKKMAF